MSRHHKTFDDLNDDCKLLILEQLSVYDLFTVAELSSSFSKAAVNVYNRTLAKVPIRFIATRNPGMHAPYPQLKYIAITDFNSTKSILKHFGSVISKLEFYANRNHGSFISNLINLHCSDTLKELNIETFDCEIFDNFVKPFKKVKRLIIEHAHRTLRNEHLEFNEQFPALENLELRAMVCNSSDIVVHFPNLRRFHVLNKPKRQNGQHVMAYLNDDDVKRFILKNPKIQSISLRCDTNDFLWFISENLPQLNELTLNDFNGDPGDQREFAFENVRSLKTDNLRGHLPNGFRDLEVLKMHNSVDWQASCLDLLEKNKDLKQLEIMQTIYRNAVDLNLLIGLIPNVVTLELHISYGVSDNSIVNFIEANEMLEKVFFYRSKTFEETAAYLEETIGNEWDIFVENQFCLYLNRKEVELE